ncbi:MAG TPA: hypothetical protein PKY66_06400 [Thermoflexales bacterium]|nr:hypothetical protein [Thermoflexales bacterium]HQX10025.1 hypothetical protein [Thermoflexales bacterium]HQY26408.1 hypothetical protein [Thermoflexales bacterium]HRA52891.1 hypothetical protein [Thermoflexales bacterium]
MTNILGVLRGFGRNTWLMLAVFGVSGFGYFGIQAVLFNLYLLRLGYDAQFIGTLIGFGQLIWALMALPAGAFGRRFGARPALYLWHGLHGLGFAIVLCAEFFPRQFLTPVIVFGWMVFWIGGAFGGSNGAPFMMRSAPRNLLNLVFSTQVIMFSVMGFVGSIVAGILPAALTTLSGASATDPAPFRAALSLTAICHGISVLILTRLRDQPDESGSGTVSSVGRPTALLLFWGGLMFLLTASEGSVRSFFNVYLDRQLQMPTADIGVVFGVAQFFSVLGAFSAPFLLRRLGASRVILFATAASGGVLVLLAAAQITWVASSAYITVILLSAVATAARTIMSQELVAGHWRIIIAGVSTVGLGLGWASSAAIGGVLVNAFGFATYFYIAAGLAILAAGLLGVFLFRKRAAPASPGPSAS